MGRWLEAIPASGCSAAASHTLTCTRDSAAPTQRHRYPTAASGSCLHTRSSAATSSPGSRRRSWSGVRIPISPSARRMRTGSVSCRAMGCAARSSSKALPSGQILLYPRVTRPFAWACPAWSRKLPTISSSSLRIPISHRLGKARTSSREGEHGPGLHHDPSRSARRHAGRGGARLVGATAARVLAGSARPEPCRTVRLAADRRRCRQADRKGRLGAAFLRPRRLHAGTLGHRRRHAHGVRGRSLRAGPARHRPEHRRAVFPGHDLAGRLRRPARRSGKQQQILAPRRPAQRGADGHLRGVHGAFADGCRHADGLIQSQRHRAGTGKCLVLRTPGARLAGFPHRRYCRIAPSAV